MNRVVHRFALSLVGAALVVVAAAPARAGLVQWSIDSTQSYLRLNIPDQAVNVDGTTAIVRLRDGSVGTSWSDNGGRRAFLGGLLTTNYEDGASIQFLPSSSQIVALQQTNLRPNPAAFSPTATSTINPDGSYTNNSTAPAAFGARVRANVSLLTADIGFLALRDVSFELASGLVPLGGGTSIAAGSTTLGMPSAGLDLDSLSSVLLSDWIPDYRNESFSLPNATNTAAGAITSLGPYGRQLTLAVSAPLMFDIEGTPLQGTITGQIVARVIIPEPTSVAMATTGAVVLGVARYRRRARSRSRPAANASTR